MMREKIMPTLTPELDVVEVQSAVRIAGKIIARNVSYEDFMAGYDGMRVEWVNGVVIEMASINKRHELLIQFLRLLFGAYLEHTGGILMGDPMVMRLNNVPSSRAPDVQVLLADRLHQVQENEVVGPANLVIEIVSGNARIDYVDKRREYELGGVPEYWILDPAKQKTLFLQLNEAGLYDEVEPDGAGVYHSRALQPLRLPVSLFWREPLPGFSEIGALVESMFR
jgi:Uma2 family endonuclease